MKAGFFETDITPFVGMELPADYRKNFIKEIHDPLKVRAAVIDDGRERVALVGVDTCDLQSDRPIARIRQQVERLCGIKSDHLLVAASHTHSGGPFTGLSLQDIGEAPELVVDLVTRYSTAPSEVYCEWVIGQIVTAICEADRRKETALLSVGSGHEDKVAFNRRFRMRNGRTYTHPGKGNPEILEPAGPIDPEVGVIAAWRPNGMLLGCIVNFTCHGTAFGGGGASADWIGYLNSTIKGAMDTDGPVVFLNGAAGDVTQVDNLSLREDEFGEKWSRFVGSRVAAEAIKVLVTAEKGELAPVCSCTQTLMLKRRIPGEASVARSLRIVQEGLKSGATDSTEWLFAKELVILDHLVRRQPELPIEVQALQVGPAVFLANPTEYFCQFGLDIKKRSPFPFTYVVALANGNHGYVPTEEAFAPAGGGYETVLTSLSNLEIGAGARIAEGCLSLAKQMKPGTVPEGPKAQLPSAPWDYGMLGPDT